MPRNVWNDIVSWQTGRLNNSTKYLLHACAHCPHLPQRILEITSARGKCDITTGSELLAMETMKTFTDDTARRTQSISVPILSFRHSHWCCQALVSLNLLGNIEHSLSPSQQVAGTERLLNLIYLLQNCSDIHDDRKIIQFLPRCGDKNPTTRTARPSSVTFLEPVTSIREQLHAKTQRT